MYGKPITMAFAILWGIILLVEISGSVCNGIFRVYKNNDNIIH